MRHVQPVLIACLSHCPRWEISSVILHNMAKQAGKSETLHPCMCFTTCTLAATQDMAAMPLRLPMEAGGICMAGGRTPP